ncbi:hypothetical protein Hamer_G007434, partial [Homarus americanus]
ATLAYGEKEIVNLLEVYQIEPQAKQKVRHVGNWLPRTPGHHAPSMTSPKEDVVTRRTDLSGLHLSCLTLSYSPFMLTEEQGDGSARLSGWMADIWEVMRERSNF